MRNTLVVLSLALFACKSTPSAEESATPGDAATPAPTEAAADVPAAEQAAFAEAKPVFDKHCASCHTKGTGGDEALDGFDMTTYPFGGHHAHEIGHEIREVLGADGGEATMPMGNPGALTDDELALVLAWADAFEQTHPHEEEHHDE